MSLKQTVYQSDAPSGDTKILTNNAVSENGCSGTLADSDSESGDDPPIAVAAFGQCEEGAEIVMRFVRKFKPEIVRPALGPYWMWQGATLGSRSVYGSFAGRKNGKPWPRYAHKLAWEWTHGPVPDGLRVCHRCDVMLCVNPSHLFLGTQKDNLDDARQKGRLIDGLHARKLSDAAYLEILTTPRERGSGLALALKFGVTRTHISRIRCGFSGSSFYRTHQQPDSLRAPAETVTVRTA